MRDQKWSWPLDQGGGGGLPAHPTQIYEALIYLFIFVLGLYLFYKTTAKNRTGLILGDFIDRHFLFPFFDRIYQEHTGKFEVQMMETIGMNMGQLLSLPFVIWGCLAGMECLKKKEPIGNNINKK